MEIVWRQSKVHFYDWKCCTGMVLPGIQTSNRWNLISFILNPSKGVYHPVCVGSGYCTSSARTSATRHQWPDPHGLPATQKQNRTPNFAGSRKTARQHVHVLPLRSPPSHPRPPKAHSQIRLPLPSIFCTVTLEPQPLAVRFLHLPFDPPTARHNLSQHASSERYSRNYSLLPCHGERRPPCAQETSDSSENRVERTPAFP